MPDIAQAFKDLSLVAAQHNLILDRIEPRDDRYLLFFTANTSADRHAIVPVGELDPTLYRRACRKAYYGIIGEADPEEKLELAHSLLEMFALCPR